MSLISKSIFRLIGASSLRPLVLVAATAGVQHATAANDESNIRSLLSEQQRMIEAQEQKIDLQRQQIDQQSTDLVAQKALLQRMQAQIDGLSQAPSTVTASQEMESEALLSQVLSLEERLASIPEDPLSTLVDANFPGAIKLPGTNTSFKIGGFVKAGAAMSFSPLESRDRFIVGSIPVGGAKPGVEEETSFTANQSRLNLEIRDRTDFGDLRAFVEGDFATSGDTFRLRHAYGQYRTFLTGKTSSTFYDPYAWPEEVDFEGLNGGTILRQTQARWFPSLGEDWDLQIAIEDPTSQVSQIDVSGSPIETDSDFNPDFGQETRAKGLTDMPDLIASIRRQWFGRWHLKTAFVLHQVKGQYSQDPGLPDRKELGWGIAESGAISTPWLDSRNNLKFQLIVGQGISRYVNDTNSLGGLDGVFTPDGSKIKTLPIMAGYLAYQHWWGNSLRSNFIVSGVEIDNEEFQPDNAYKRTVRASANIFWSPAPRVDLAMEYLWGERTNKNGEHADASQIQIASKYRF